MTAPRRNEEGFVLAAAILAMVVVGAALAAGYFIANQEYHIGKSMREAVRVFYAAEAGLQREYATWSVKNRWMMQGGNVVPVGPVMLANGATYRGTVTRVDNNPGIDTKTERYYVIQIFGSTRPPLVGEEVRNDQTLVLRVRYYDFCCSAAITAKDTFTQAGSSAIDGYDNTPAQWSGYCDSASTDPVPGVEVECAGCYEKDGAASSTGGVPPVETDTALQSQSLTQWDEVTYDLLRSLAGKTYPPGFSTSSAGGTWPAITTDPNTGLPVCDEPVWMNWGAPLDPSHPCFDYFPILYAEGDIKLAGNTRGQGMLVIEGDLTLAGSYEFYGIVLVKGHIRTEGTGGKIQGSVIVAGQGNGNSLLAGNAEVRYSSCAVMRAKRFAELAKKEPLPLRPWSERMQ